MSLRRPPFDQRPISTDADLTRLWRDHLSAEPFRSRVLWVMFLDPDGRPSGPVITIENLPDGPYDMETQDLVEMCRGILDGPGTDGPRGPGSVALLMSRPCGDPWTVSDRAWGRFLSTGADHIGGRVWPVHVAHRGELKVFALPTSVAADTTGRACTITL